IQSGITIGASQTWNIANANTSGNPAGLSQNEDLAFFGQAANIPFSLGGFTVTKLGAGVAAFTSGYTFSNGAFNVNEGVLHIQGGSNRVTTVNSDVTFNVANNGTLRFAAQSGAVGISMVNNGAINLNGGSTLALLLNQNNALNLTGNVATSGSLTWTTLGGGFTTALATFSGNLSGNGNITYQNTATAANGFLRFTGDNSAFTGTLNVNGASNNRILRLAGANAGSASATWSVAANNTLQIDGVDVQLGTLNGAGMVINSHASDPSTISVGAGDFSGSIPSAVAAMALTKVGPGTLTLSGPNSYTGTTTVNAGTLITTPAHTGATNVFVADGATFGIKLADPATTFSASSVTTGTTTGATLQFDTGGLGNPTAPILTTTALTPTAPTTLKLLGTALASTNGTPFTLIDYTDPLAGMGFGGFSLSLPFRVTGSLVDNSANTSIDVNLTVGIPKWNGTVNADWNIDTVGDGSVGTANWVSASGPNTYIENGVNSDAVIFDDTATGPTTVNLTAALNPAGVSVNNSTKNYVFTGAGSINGTTGLVKAGTGTLTIANTTFNNYTGGTRIDGGTLQLGDGITAGAGDIAGAILVNTGATLELNRPDDSFLGNAISGTGTLKKSLPNVATISGVATFGGSVEIAAGTLRFNGGGNLSGVVSGPGVLESTGGTLELSGVDPNTNSGGTTVSAGVLRLNKGFGVNAIGGDLLITGSGQLALVGGEQIADTATITFTGTSGDSIPTQTGGLETVLNVVVNGTGQVLLRNGFTVSGTATVQNGILGVPSNHTNVTVNAINMTSPNAIVRLGAQTNPSTLNVGPGGITASGGDIQVKFNMTNGDAALNLGGDLITTGDLTFSNGGYTGTSLNAIILSDNRTFNIGAGTTTTVAPAITGFGGLIKAGDGTLTINGPQSYLSLLVSGGTMNLNTSLANVEITDDGGTLNINADATNSTIHANDGTVRLTVNQTLAGLDIGADGVVVLGALVPAPEATLDAPALVADSVQAVPEPGTLGLLAFGALALLRRRTKWRRPAKD
ncbi:MAG TPA: autotransporter-associated beta strand repeat-containing protein, partial [Chthoniobacteraceae bacterium]|nr:autotransporter-associated beta strand repeat-containing protein [Chthoniobacteraceae bacterium]